MRPRVGRRTATANQKQTAIGIDNLSEVLDFSMVSSTSNRIGNGEPDYIRFFAETFSSGACLVLEGLPAINS